MKQYVAISKEEKIELEKILYDETVKCFRTEETDGEYFIYEVQIQDIRFRTAMTDDVLKKVITYSIELLEEFKTINNSGINREKFVPMAGDKLDKKDEDMSVDELLLPIRIMDELATERMKEIIIELAQLCRVGGAYWLIISKPGLYFAMYSVYEYIVDYFDEKEHYRTAVYFLLRSIMKINSQELN